MHVSGFLGILFVAAAFSICIINCPFCKKRMFKFVWERNENDISPLKQLFIAIIYKKYICGHCEKNI